MGNILCLLCIRSGVRKPGLCAFEVTCARLGARPEDCLLVDDVAVTAEAAQEAGTQAHIFEKNTDTVTRIAEHLGGAGPFSW
ncbi:hypothetical protein GCM10009863_35070 [Streptomyces axinellae]|uniref:Hydrolase n=1 Tax=Streptomyces axinellae TaxID=552788 RepID=A0ABP6CMP4_9ACTN